MKMNKLDLDKEKLREEDRRFLLNESMNKTITNNQILIKNHHTLITTFALLFSGFAIIFAVGKEWAQWTYLVISILGSLILISQYYRTQNKINNELTQLKEEHGELFRYHFNYAEKELI